MICFKCTNKLDDPNSNTESNVRQIDRLLANRFYKNKKINLYSELKNLSSDNNYIEKTETDCAGCDEPFNTTPFPLPIAYDNGKFIYYGIHCSEECAVLNLLTEPAFKDRVSDIYSLVCLLHYKLFGEFKNVRSSPVRKCLKKKGGYMSLDEYRNFHYDNDGNTKKTYKIPIIKFPPGSCMLSTIEEIDAKHIQINPNDKFIDKQNITKNSDELVLKRRRNKDNNILKNIVATS